MVFFVGVEAEEARVEGWYVLRQQGLRVAFGVERGEQHLYATGIIAEQGHGFAQGGQRGGADVGALRVAEEQHHGLAAKIGEAARLPVMVGELEILAPIDH